MSFILLLLRIVCSVHYPVYGLNDVFFWLFLKFATIYLLQVLTLCLRCSWLRFLSPLCSCLFTPLVIFFAVHKILSFVQPHFSISEIVFCAVESCSEGPCLYLCLHVFSPNTFNALGLILRSLIHFEFMVGDTDLVSLWLGLFHSSATCPSRARNSEFTDSCVLGQMVPEGSWFASVLEENTGQLGLLKHVLPPP